MHSPVAGPFHRAPSGTLSCQGHKLLKGVWPASHQGGGASEIGWTAVPWGNLRAGVRGDGQAAGTRHLGTSGQMDVWSHRPQAFLMPPQPSLHGSLLPRGLPGNIFLVNVYIFSDSWFICGQSVPGERHTGHSRLADRGWPHAPGASGAAPCPGALALLSLALCCSEALRVGLRESSGRSRAQVQLAQLQQGQNCLELAQLEGSTLGMGLA